MTHPVDKTGRIKPFDSESGDSWLFSEDVSSDLLENGLGWRISIELLRVIFVVDIVSDSNKLSAVVGTGEEDDGDAEDFSIWDALCVRWVGLEDELVDANWDGADEEGVELLVMFIATSR